MRKTRKGEIAVGRTWRLLGTIDILALDLHVMKTALIVSGWVMGGVLATLVISYVPGALNVVDDEKWGRVIGGFLLPTVAAFIVSGVLFAKQQRVAACVISGLIILAYVVLNAYVVVRA